MSGRRRPKSPVEPGELVAFRYRVEGTIAAGGMGVVVAARHEALDQAVAIKFLDQELMDEQTVPRFLREARAAARIQSEHVARVFDCGTLESGVPYMVMERLTGQDLGRELKARGPFAITEAVDLALQALEGVAEAHALGFVHRDLKPSNLFLVARNGAPPVVKVLDFGISKLSSGADASIEDGLTTTSLMLGSPRYMSPEQAQNAKGVDARTDIWSLGVVLFEILAGRPPYLGTTIGEVIAQLVQVEPPLLRSCRADAPAELEWVLARCLSRDRTTRWQNAAELAFALAPFASPRATASLERIRGLLTTGKLPAQPMAALEPTRTPMISLPNAAFMAPAALQGSTIPGAAMSQVAGHPASRATSGTKWKWVALSALAFGGAVAVWGVEQGRRADANAAVAASNGASVLSAPAPIADAPAASVVGDLAPASGAASASSPVPAPDPPTASAVAAAPSPSTSAASTSPKKPVTDSRPAHAPPQTAATPRKNPGDALLRQRD